MRSSSRIDEARVLNPGILRHRIVWQIKELTGQDSFGADIYDWQVVASCPAQVRTLTGRELEAAQQRWTEAKYAIRQHFYRGLGTTHRIYWYIDGVEKFLDPLEVSDLAGTGRVQDIVAKEWAP